MKLLLKNFREINQFTYISYFYETSLTDFSHLPLRITVVVWGNDGTLVILRKNYVKSTYSILNYTTALWVIFKKEFFFLHHITFWKLLKNQSYEFDVCHFPFLCLCVVKFNTIKLDCDDIHTIPKFVFIATSFHDFAGFWNKSKSVCKPSHNQLRWWCMKDVIINIEY